MALFEKRGGSAKAATAGEIAAALSIDEAKEAEIRDRSTGEDRSPLMGREPENLSIVEYTGIIVEHSSDPSQQMTREQLERMNAPEIRALGHDRGYWRRGVSLATKVQIIEKFLTCQENAGGLTGPAAERGS